MPPESITYEHYRRVVVNLIFSIGENAPELRLHSDYPKHGGCECLFIEAFGWRAILFRSEILDAAIENAEGLVGLAFVPELEISRPIDAVSLVFVLQRNAPDDHEPIRMRKPQRP